MQIQFGAKYGIFGDDPALMETMLDAVKSKARSQGVACEGTSVNIIPDCGEHGLMAEVKSASGMYFGIVFTEADADAFQAAEQKGQEAFVSYLNESAPKPLTGELLFCDQVLTALNADRFDCVNGRVLGK